MNNEVLKSLIQSYIRAKDRGEFDDETYYHEKIDGYRDFQLHPFHIIPFIFGGKK